VLTPTVTDSDADTASADRPRRRSRRLRWPSWVTALRLIAAIGGGVLLYASFPPRPLWWLAPAAFALLGLALDGRRARAGFGYGFCFGLGFLVPLLAWTGVYVGAVAWLPLAAAESVFVGLGGAAIAVVFDRRGGPLWAALLWVADEALRARIPFGGFPWGKVAFGQAGGGYLSVAAIGGTPLLGFAVALTGFGLAGLVLWLSRRPRPEPTAARGAGSHGLTGLIIAVLAVAVPIIGSAAAWPLVRTDPNAGTATVAAVQGNVPRLGLDFNAQRRAVLDYHVAETERLAAQVRAGQVPHPQVVIWPENSSDIDPYANPDAYAEISQAVAGINAPTLVGAVVSSQPPGPKNTAILWVPGQGPVQQYVKRKLQPFGETMPMRSFFRLFTSYVDIAGRFVRGTTPVVFPMGPARVGVDTCYEVAFDDVVRASVPGSTLLAVPTNNATFGHSEMTYQQLAMDQERAVEHGRSVVVAATSGISAIVLPNGVVTQSTSLFTPAALVTSVPLRSTTTMADQLGEWPEWTMVVAGLLALAFAIVARRRARPTPVRETK
jgi:apolipoprotein N-acyltransferase